MNAHIKRFKCAVRWQLMAGVLFAVPAAAQDGLTLTLERAYQLAEQHYPLIRQRDLVKRTSGLTIENIGKGYLPQLSVNGQATYQSDVTAVPVRIPGINIEAPNKDQYKLTAELSQILYDGGNISNQKKLQQVNELVEDQKVTVDMYKVKERINTLYLGTLLLDEQLKQTALLQKDIQLGIDKISAQVRNGTALRSNQQVLEAELLKNEQRKIELTANRKGLLDVLSLFLGQDLPESTVLEQPATNEVSLTETVKRPELTLFTYQDSLFKVQEKMVSVKNRPRASAFIQGGYGRPGLNMLVNEFDFFYIGGLRLSWNLGGLYTSKKEKQILSMNQQMVGVQKDLFLLNTNTQLKQQEAELKKLQQLIGTDQAIIDLREKVKIASNAQLENGVITASDFLREVNAEDQARLLLISHKLQMLQAQINYRTISGNQ
ncbi:TolC family protein [Pseudobacter ginsenosidimutans]|uniref:Outer membrane protein TolC n=1 Tax=Pseudobacter ginsenosidimutans TaxID=661488 RepID=A0A4V2EZM4_9BACT|nr:TolC family protein [Pseudobacter ginsenosidimutans]QEC45469.1 TolC family protein [Pseudobacter ginsenosidimutans]RZS67000.1 outer membrane protein TolC [Pseudobacter ginsenosidimutans]